MTDSLYARLEGLLRRSTNFSNKLSGRMRRETLGVILSVARRIELRRGKALYYQADPPENAYLILTGTVHKVKYRADETSLLLGRAGAGNWLGITEMILSTPYLYDAVGETRCEILSFSKRDFGTIRAREEMKEILLIELAKDFHRLHGEIEFNTPQGRLARYIIKNMPAAAGEKCHLRCTQEDIALSIGVTRETVNKYLNLFQRSGLIRIGRGTLEVIDRIGLESLF